MVEGDFLLASTNLSNNHQFTLLPSVLSGLGMFGRAKKVDLEEKNNHNFSKLKIMFIAPPPHHDHHHDHHGWKSGH